MVLRICNGRATRQSHIIQRTWSLCPTSRLLSPTKATRALEMELSSTGMFKINLLRQWGELTITLKNTWMSTSNRKIRFRNLLTSTPNRKTSTPRKRGECSLNLTSITRSNRSLSTNSILQLNPRAHIREGKKSQFKSLFRSRNSNISSFRNQLIPDSEATFLKPRSLRWM